MRNAGVHTYIHTYRTYIPTVHDAYVHPSPIVRLMCSCCVPGDDGRRCRPRAGLPLVRNPGWGRVRVAGHFLGECVSVLCCVCLYVDVQAVRRGEPHPAALQRGGEQGRHGAQDQARGSHDQSQVSHPVPSRPILCAGCMGGVTVHMIIQELHVFTVYVCMNVCMYVCVADRTQSMGQCVFMYFLFEPKV